MATFVLVHGAGDAGWYWHLVEAELRARGHDTIAPDLPCTDESASLDDYAVAVTEAAGNRRDLVLVGQSYGSFTATLAASRLPARLLVLVAGMIPAPGETPGEWWTNTGYRQAVEHQAATGHDDPLVSYYKGVPRELAEEALRHGSRGESAVVWGTPLAFGRLAGRADAVRPVPGRPDLPGRVPPAGGPRPAGHPRGRDTRLPLRRAQPPRGTQRPADRLPPTHSTVTLLARLRGLSMSRPSVRAAW